jgi:hypothetical protein
VEVRGVEVRGQAQTAAACKTVPFAPSNKTLPAITHASSIPRRLGNYWAGKVLSKKLEVSMTIKVLSAELARERAWRVYCLMNPSAQGQIKLKARLDSYLATLPTIDSNSLTVDGLKYLKRLETLGAEKSEEHR